MLREKRYQKNNKIGWIFNRNDYYMSKLDWLWEQKEIGSVGLYRYIKEDLFGG